MRKVLCIFGTRPKAIKVAPVVHSLQSEDSKFNVLVCVTAQHREMLDQVLSLFEINPNYDLNIMTTAQSLVQITVRAIEGLDRVIEKEKPDIVLVQGDTTTAFCGALAAFYHKLNHHRLKPVGLKEPMYVGLESAKADSPLWGNMEVTIVLLKILGGYILHNNLIGHVA